MGDPWPMDTFLVIIMPCFDEDSVYYIAHVCPTNRAYDFQTWCDHYLTPLWVTRSNMKVIMTLNDLVYFA